ncbi:PucR family transcriptional regulator [Aeromicrobium sp.]|uniref:PucR family transcriptional regulator n=1 Tax=Aeromicrobium sp. TaxID=1871063 RepID=UPI003D6B06D5
MSLRSATGRRPGKIRFDAETLELAAWTRERLDIMALAAADAIWAELPAYRESDLHGDVAAHCERIFGVFVTTIEEQRTPSVEDFPWTAAHALRRVESGISLIDFLRAFRIAQLTLWEHIQDYVREHTGAGEMALSLVTHVMHTIEAGSSAAATTYLEAQQYDLADQERIHRDLIDDLLDGRRPTVAPRLTSLDAAGLTDDQPFIVVTARSAGTLSDDERELMAVKARKMFAFGAAGIYVVRQVEVIGLVPLNGCPVSVAEARLERVAEELQTRGVEMAVGLSTPHVHLDSTPDAFSESQLACESLEGRPGVASLSSLSTLDYLVRRPDETVRRLIRPQVRSFLVEDLAGDGVYSESLRAYVEHDLNAKEAAKSLHVHVNTMYYRLDRIATRTGCDLRKVDQVIELLLAVRMLSDTGTAS